MWTFLGEFWRNFNRFLDANINEGKNKFVLINIWFFLGVEHSSINSTPLPLEQNFRFSKCYLIIRSQSPIAWFTAPTFLGMISNVLWSKDLFQIFPCCRNLSNYKKNRLEKAEPVSLSLVLFRLRNQTTNSAMARNSWKRKKSSNSIFFQPNLDWKICFSFILMNFTTSLRCYNFRQENLHLSDLAHKIYLYLKGRLFVSSKNILRPKMQEAVNKAKHLFCVKLDSTNNLNQNFLDRN